MRIHEVAPPGREKQVKKLKKKFDDPGAPYAIAWAQHNKHGKPKKKESHEKGPSDMGMNKYGLSATKLGDKFRSYRHGKLTGEFDSMEELQKHQMELIKDESVDPLRSDRGAKEELAKEIYYNNDEYQKMYPTWEDFMDSEDFDEENNRLRSKFEAPFQKKPAKPFSRTQKALNTLGSMFGSRKAQGRLNVGNYANDIVKGWEEFSSPATAKKIERELIGYLGSVGPKASPKISAQWLNKEHKIEVKSNELDTIFNDDGTFKTNSVEFINNARTKGIDNTYGPVKKWFRDNHEMGITDAEAQQFVNNPQQVVTTFIQRKNAGELEVPKGNNTPDQTQSTTSNDQSNDQENDPTLAQIKKLNPDATGKAVKALDKLKPENLKPLTPPEEQELAPILNKIASALTDPAKRSKLVNMMTSGKYSDFNDFANMISESISRDDLAKLDYLARQGLVPSNKVSRFKTAMRTLAKGKDLSITYKDDVVDVVVKLASIITKPGVMQMVKRGLKKK